jgi:hypothetical protein
LSFATPLAVIGNATAGSEIRLPEDTDNGSNYVAIKAPDTLASNLTLTLPSADGTSGQVLQTNGSGVLSFAGVSASAGQVIQVVSTTKSDYFSSSSTNTFIDITGLSVSITPSSASNKILIMCDLSAGGNDCRQGYRLVRDATAISVGNSDGSRPQTTVGSSNGLSGNDQINASFNFLDSPSTTSSITYKVQFSSESAGFAINGTYGNSNASSIENARATSTITLMEIKG